MYFLDFESFQPAIPFFDNSRPYEQIVFQYSLHYVEHEGGELKHTEFLAYPGSDPRRALTEQLCADIPLDVCTTAYNMGFEKGRIHGLAELYPDLLVHGFISDYFYADDNESGNESIVLENANKNLVEFKEKDIKKITVIKK